ncbi:hypothetical protein NX059_005075 [Plenodomus lindquistii]|nr:hypothetical protein NX059_005075 [Plenodomus lindquistii]
MNHIITDFQKFINFGKTKQIALLLATRYQARGFWRTREVISAHLMADAVKDIETALKGSKMLSPSQFARCHQLTIISMLHDNDNDTEPHYTLLVQDEFGVEIAKSHVTQDPAKQQVVTAFTSVL